MTSQELLKEAKSLCDRRESYLNSYKKDVDYPTLKKAFDALPTAYNKWAIEILGAPSIGKAPINPFVAAGIGDAIAGIGGAVVMGVSAQNQMNKYNDRVAAFNKQLASINSAGEKVAYLVDQIKSIISRSPMNVTYSEQDIKDMIINHIETNSNKSIREKQLTIDERYSRFENNEQFKALNELVEDGTIEKIGLAYYISPAYYCKKAFLNDMEINYESRKKIVELMHLVDIMEKQKYGDVDEIWEACKKDKILSPLTKDMLRNHLIALTGRGVLEQRYNPTETFSFHFTKEQTKYLKSINKSLSQQEEDATLTEKQVRNEIHAFNDEYWKLSNEYNDKMAVYLRQEAQIIENEDSTFANPEYNEIALIEEKIEQQKNKIQNLSGLPKILMGKIEANKLSDLEYNLREHEQKAEKIDDEHNKAIDIKLLAARTDIDSIEKKLFHYARQREVILDKIKSVERVFGWCRNPDVFPLITVTPFIPMSQRKKINSEHNKISASADREKTPKQKPDNDFAAMYSHGPAFIDMNLDSSGDKGTYYD